MREYFRPDGDTLNLPEKPCGIGRGIEAAVYFLLAVIFALTACSLLKLVIEGFAYTLAVLAALALAVWLIGRYALRWRPYCAR